MGVCEPTPHTTTSGTYSDPLPQPPSQEQASRVAHGGAPARRRPARSSSPLRGCGRSSWTPPARRRQQQPVGKPGKMSQPVTPSTVTLAPLQHALLTRPALMGARTGSAAVPRPRPETGFAAPREPFWEPRRSLPEQRRGDRLRRGPLVTFDKVPVDIQVIAMLAWPRAPASRRP